MKRIPSPHYRELVVRRLRPLDVDQFEPADRLELETFHPFIPRSENESRARMPSIVSGVTRGSGASPMTWFTFRSPSMDSPDCAKG